MLHVYDASVYKYTLNTLWHCMSSADILAAMQAGSVFPPILPDNGHSCLTANRPP